MYTLLVLGMSLAALWTPRAVPAVLELVPTCLAADETSDFYSVALASLLSKIDSQHVALRSDLQLPQLPSTVIKLTTSAGTCVKAAAAMDLAQVEPLPNRRMFVFELGTTRYAVVDLRDPPPATTFSNASGGVFFFDRTWKVLGAVAM